MKKFLLFLPLFLHSSGQLAPYKTPYTQNIIHEAHFLQIQENKIKEGHCLSNPEFLKMFIKRRYLYQKNKTVAGYKSINPLFPNLNFKNVIHDFTWHEKEAEDLLRTNSQLTNALSHITQTMKLKRDLFATLNSYCKDFSDSALVESFFNQAPKKMNVINKHRTDAFNILADLIKNEPIKKIIFAINPTFLINHPNISNAKFNCKELKQFFQNTTMTVASLIRKINEINNLERSIKTKRISNIDQLTKLYLEFKGLRRTLKEKFQAEGKTEFEAKKSLTFLHLLLERWDLVAYKEPICN